MIYYKSAVVYDVIEDQKHYFLFMGNLIKFF